MKTLVVYYSRSGVTKKVALALADAFNADVEELIDTKKRSGSVGFARAGIDAARRKAVPIEPVERDPAAYDLVIVGGPVWANTLSTAVRSYLAEFGGKIAKSAVFCTTHTSGIEETLEEMAGLIGGDVVRRMGLKQKSVKRDETGEELDAFVSALRAEN